MQDLIDDLVEAHRNKHSISPIPQNAYSFSDLYAQFCERMGWHVHEKRVRAIVREKVESGEWKVQRVGSAMLYFLPESK